MLAEVQELHDEQHLEDEAHEPALADDRSKPGDHRAGLTGTSRPDRVT